jgi:N-acetylmuramoyl-L-alanine amidase
VPVSNEAARLKARLLKAAVDDNADAIADRLPPQLRPARRWTALSFYWARVLLLPVSILVGGPMLAANWSIAAQPTPAPPVPHAAPSERLVTPAPASIPDPSLLARSLPAGALGLGVRRIVLDAGHGGAHPGTASATGLVEKEVTLDLADRARRLLLERGFEVVMTRAVDHTVSLKDRAATANQQRGDIFVSIHLNSLGPTTGHGIETFYLGPGQIPEHDAIAATENEHSGYSLADMRTLLDGIYVDARRDESKRLAQSVQRAIVKRLGKTDPKVDDRGVKTAPFVVLVATEMPAILAEVSCLSDADEAERLGTAAHRQAIAEALVNGIQGFVDEKPNWGKRKDTDER